jgi:hypothetical protein
MKINVPRVAVATTVGILLVPAVAAAGHDDGKGYGPGNGKWQDHGQSHGDGNGKGHGHGNGRHQAERPVTPVAPVTPATEPAAAPDATAETTTRRTRTRTTAPAPAKRTVGTTTRGRAHGHTHGKTFLFRGRVVAVDAATATVTVKVRGGNRLARRFRGETVTFELSSAKIRAIEADGAAGITAGDLVADDAVIVQARLPRSTKPDGSTIAARKLVNLTDREPTPIVEPAPTDPVVDEPVVEPTPTDPVVEEQAPTA